MSNKLQIKIKELASRGYKITEVRRAILDIFLSAKQPISPRQLMGYLAKRNITTHKTTVYREIDFFLEQKYINTITLGGGKQLYEFVATEHHHIVCLKCNNIRCVTLGRHLQKEEKAIEEKMNFKIESHSLEFYGFCQRCFS